jgi:hypothetical protein
MHLSWVKTPPSKRIKPWIVARTAIQSDELLNAIEDVR